MSTFKQKIQDIHGSENGFCERGFELKFLDINLDPRILFGQDYIDSQKWMPKEARDALLARILHLREERGAPVVSVTMDSRVECTYPKGWTTQFMIDLIHNKIFVRSDDQEFSKFNMLHSALHKLTKEEVMELIAN